MTPQVLELSFPAQASYLVLARLGLAGVAPTAHLDPMEIADMKLAVTEACANAVRHAYPDGSDGTVVVRMAVADGALTVEVADTGCGLEASRPRKPDPDTAGEGGMGLSIIRAVVDELDIETPAAGGTIVRFTKRPAAV